MALNEDALKRKAAIWPLKLHALGTAWEDTLEKEGQEIGMARASLNSNSMLPGIRDDMLQAVGNKSISRKKLEPALHEEWRRAQRSKQEHPVTNMQYALIDAVTEEANLQLEKAGIPKEMRIVPGTPFENLVPYGWNT
ncbi:MAG: hypothetical protein K9G62_06015 [Alphaproteobacteria bacterium]|nr:hypothetical protein [Alphaproteobacteria bacterium]